MRPSHDGFLRRGNYTLRSAASFLWKWVQPRFETTGMWTRRTDERSWRRHGKKVEEHRGEISFHLTLFMLFEFEKKYMLVPVFKYSVSSRKSLTWPRRICSTRRTQLRGRVIKVLMPRDKLFIVHYHYHIKRVWLLEGWCLCSHWWEKLQYTWDPDSDKRDEEMDPPFSIIEVQLYLHLLQKILAGIQNANQADHDIPQGDRLHWVIPQ